MNFWKEFNELKKVLLLNIGVFTGLSIFFFGFNIKEISFINFNLFLPFPSLYSLSVLFFKHIQENLIPANVELIAINPLSAFLAQIIVSLFLAFIAGLPFFLYQFIKYISPAFSWQEKIKIIKIWIPSLFLFITGCLFAYFLLIPVTLQALYAFPTIMEITPFFVVNEFILFILGLMLISGIIFLLPIFMILLSWIGLVKKTFWKDNWRYSASIFLIFSAIITPDGSGITMIILSIPLLILYFLGYCLTPK